MRGADPGPAPPTKMRTLFWDRLPDTRVAGTFWESHPPDYSLLDAQRVGALFQAAIRRPASPGRGSGGDGGSAKKQAAAVLDTRRATNIGG